jgi:hypothetical protein
MRMDNCMIVTDLARFLLKAAHTEPMDTAEYMTVRVDILSSQSSVLVSGRPLEQIRSKM